ncbi:MAG: peptidoglycan editing factor PgeF [Clostridia bacterium]|nr:peptidoglycan editing factor PgeF [Clostridia bacterium]
MIIGVTGNSGSGKTSICKLIKNRCDAIIIDADEIVKKLSFPGEQYFNEIVKAFGKEVLLASGEIDKIKLADIIFSDYKKRESLNFITYKYVAKEIEKQAKANKNTLTIIDAPLLIEAKLDSICDIVISVIANTQTKIERICKRDNINKEDAQKRLNAQPKDEFYIKNSNYIIINNNINLQNQEDNIIELIKSDILYNKETVIIQCGNLKILQFKKLLEYNNIKHAFTLKPLDFGSNDTYKENKEIFDNNYKLICNLLGINYKNIVRPYQTHTENVKKIVNEKGIFPIELDNIDGLITNEKDKILSLTFADCTPIYLFDKQKNIIGNIHSGWKGTLKQIAKEAVNKMINEFKSNPQDIICVIGPTIRKCHFEVDEDIKNNFYSIFCNMLSEKDFIKNEKQKYYIDTVCLNKKMLIQAGILEQNIIDSNICTVCNNKFMHSYREQKEEAGRNTAIITLI